MGRAKGVTLADIRAFVKEQAGDAGIARLRAALGPADRAAFDQVVAVDWYPFDTYVRVLGAIPAGVERDPKHALAEFGRFAARGHVSRLYRVLFLALHPATMLEKVGDYWSRFSDTGIWHVTREGEKRARGELSGLSDPDVHHCEFLVAYIATLFERIGAKGARCSHPRCRTRGEAACSFVVEWS